MLKPPPDWPRALTLLDEALALHPEARADWLERTAAREPSVSPLLRKLLSAHRRVETHAILATLPLSLRNKMSVETGQIGLLIGPFELLESLGRGGMGSVWRARYADGRLKRDVAVKLPAASDDPAALAALRERFARERDFLGQLEHPNIARLYDTGVSDDGQPFLAMEYVVGKPIDDYCDEHRLPIKARLGLFLQVLDAVEYAHRQLVLHRDLKPGNVLVDQQGQVRLLDFGVAKLLPPTQPALSTAATAALDAPSSTGTDLTEMAGAAITLAYAAPEQISHAPLSTATDVYALGVMLYRLLTGLSPYQPTRDTRGSLEDAVLAATPGAASTRHYASDVLASRQITAPALRKALRDDLDIILAKSLKKNANERYPTVNAFADDLRRHQAQQPITARPDSAWYRSTRFVARHGAAVAASTLAVAALVSTTGVAVWQTTVATANAVRANKAAARSQATQKFLSGLFANADPEKFKDSTVSTQEILARGRVTAESAFADDPEALADVLSEIADIYGRAGSQEDALAVQQRRLAVLQAMPAASVSAVADAQLALGQALATSGVSARNAEALPTLKAAQVFAVERGADTRQQIWAQVLIADQYRFERRLPEARTTMNEVLTRVAREVAIPDKYLAAVFATSGAIARDEGRIDDARTQFAKALDIDASGKGRGPLEQTLTRTMLAQLDYDVGAYLSAAQQALKVVNLASDTLGDISGNLSPARRIVVLAFERAGDIESAQRYAQSLVDVELSSRDPMRIATGQLVLGRVAMTAGSLAEAGGYLNSARSAFAENLVWLARTEALRAELSLRNGNPEAAMATLTPILEKQLARHIGPHVEVARTREWLAVAEARLGRMTDSQTRMSLASTTLSEVRKANHPTRVRCESYLVLLDANRSLAERSAKLKVLATQLAEGREDQLPLVRSLQGVALRLDGGFDPLASPSLFPILE